MPERLDQLSDSRLLDMLIERVMIFCRSTEKHETSRRVGEVKEELLRRLGERMVVACQID
jgi:hypothetical protein